MKESYQTIMEKIYFLNIYMILLILFLRTKIICFYEMIEEKGHNILDE
jgi:hypothetical protein